MQIHMSVRGVISISLVIVGLGIFVVVNNSKNKHEYDRATGIIEYFDKEYQDLPIRHKGDFRYLKINSYPFVFEIFEPNSIPTDKSLGNLQIGDTIDIYYYETSDTKKSALNRYTQFIDRKGEPYFIRDSFQKQLGYVLIGLCLLINIMAIILWKKKKLNW